MALAADGIFKRTVFGNRYRLCRADCLRRYAHLRLRGNEQLGAGDDHDLMAVERTASGERGKLSQAQAGYMELAGAVKSGYCRVVEGEVSGERGCSDLFKPVSAEAEHFNCENCLYYEGEGEKE